MDIDDLRKQMIRCQFLVCQAELEVEHAQTIANWTEWLDVYNIDLNSSPTNRNVNHLAEMSSEQPPDESSLPPENPNRRKRLEMLFNIESRMNCAFGFIAEFLDDDQAQVLDYQNALDSLHRFVTETISMIRGFKEPAIGFESCKSRTVASTDVGEKCSVCMDEYKVDEHVSILPCGHYFHIECIRTWFSEKLTCPECRYFCI